MSFSENELMEMTVAELTEVHNKLFNKSVKKVKGAKAKVVAAIVAAQPKRVRKTPGTRDVLRGLFPSVGERKRTEGVLTEVTQTADVKADTVWVGISDLKNPKWAGAAGTIEIVRDGDFLKRVA